LTLTIWHTVGWWANRWLGEWSVRGWSESWARRCVMHGGWHRRDDREWPGQRARRRSASWWSRPGAAAELTTRPTGVRCTCRCWGHEGIRSRRSCGMGCSGDAMTVVISAILDRLEENQGW